MRWAAMCTLLAGCSAAGADTEAAIHAGGDKVLTAGGVPSVADLAEFFRERQPEAILLPRTQLGRSLGPGLAQLLGGSLCRFAADLAVDAVYQRIVAHQPVLDDAARVQVRLLDKPAVVLMETSLLPAAFKESVAAGRSERHRAELGRAADVRDGGAAREAADARRPRRRSWWQGRGWATRPGFAAAKELAEALGGVVAGDVTALDAGWITEEAARRPDGRDDRPEAVHRAGRRRGHRTS